jgi:hypothetical protein
MVRVRSPGVLMIVIAYGLILIPVVILAIALRMPSVGVSFTREGTRVLARTSAGQVIAVLAPDTPVTFTGGDQWLIQPAQGLASEYAPSGSFDQLRQWYADRDRLGAIITARGAKMRMATPTGERSTPLTPVKRGLGDLSPDVWLLLVQATVVGMVGVWLAVLRPNDWGARLFLLSCLGIALAAFSDALADARELTASSLLLRTKLHRVRRRACRAGRPVPPTASPHRKPESRPVPRGSGSLVGIFDRGRPSLHEDLLRQPSGDDRRICRRPHHAMVAVEDGPRGSRRHSVGWPDDAGLNQRTDDRDGRQAGVRGIFAGRGWAFDPADLRRLRRHSLRCGSLQGVRPGTLVVPCRYRRDGGRRATPGGCVADIRAEGEFPYSVGHRGAGRGLPLSSR